MDKHTIGAVIYASVPLFIGLYLIVIDAGLLKDKSGHDDLYVWIKNHRVITLLAAMLLIAFAVLEFFRFMGAYEGS